MTRGKQICGKKAAKKMRATKKQKDIYEFSRDKIKSWLNDNTDINLRIHGSGYIGINSILKFLFQSFFEEIGEVTTTKGLTSVDILSVKQAYENLFKNENTLKPDWNDFLN